MSACLLEQRLDAKLRNVEDAVSWQILIKYGVMRTYAWQTRGLQLVMANTLFFVATTMIWIISLKLEYIKYDILIANHPYMVQFNGFDAYKS